MQIQESIDVNDDSDDQDERPNPLDPEHNLIGALLHLNTRELQALLEFVHDDDLADWRARAVLETIRTLVNDQRPADPVAVSSAARSSGRNIEAIKRLDHYMLDVYRDVMTPTNVRFYAHRVVEDSYRRDFEAGGVRLQQMASAWADIEDLEQFTGELVRRWRVMRQRVRALSGYQS